MTISTWTTPSWKASFGVASTGSCWISPPCSSVPEGADRPCSRGSGGGCGVVRCGAVWCGVVWCGVCKQWSSLSQHQQCHQCLHGHTRQQQQRQRPGQCQARQWARGAADSTVPSSSSPQRPPRMRRATCSRNGSRPVTATNRWRISSRYNHASSALPTTTALRSSPRGGDLRSGVSAASTFG